MFGFLGILLTYALLSFGGVLPHNALALNLALGVGIVGLAGLRAFRGEAIDTRVLGVLILGVALSVGSGPRIGVPLFAGAWAFYAIGGSEVRERIRFLHFLLFIGLGEALLGLAQYFVAPGWIFGYLNAVSSPSGTLINRNHFAGLLEMLIPVAFGLAYIAARRDSAPHRESAGSARHLWSAGKARHLWSAGEAASRAYVYLMAGAFMALALIFSASRMGIVSFFATAMFMATVVRMRQSQKRLATTGGTCGAGN